MTREPPSRTRIGLPDWAKLIPKLEGYFDPGPASPEHYAFFESSLEVALGFSDLFWPPFTEYNSMVFRGVPESLDEAGESNIANWLKAFEGNCSQVERMINHIHLIDLFCERSREGSGYQIAYLGRVVRETWEAKLKLDFPGKTFAVELFLSEPDESGESAVGDWLITFYQRQDDFSPPARI